MTPATFPLPALCTPQSLARLVAAYPVEMARAARHMPEPAVYFDAEPGWEVERIMRQRPGLDKGDGATR